MQGKPKPSQENHKQIEAAFVISEVPSVPVFKVKKLICLFIIYNF